MPSFDASAVYPDRPDVATVNPERFGKDAAALASLGGEIGDFGSRLMTARKRAMENDAVSSGHLESMKWLSDTADAERLSYNKKDENGNDVINPDGTIAYDVDGFAKSMEEKILAHREDMVAKMPTGDAQRGYLDATNSMFGRAYQESMAWENMTKAQTYQKNFEVRNNARANFSINNPDLNTTAESIDQLQKELSGSVGNINTPGEAQDLYRKAEKTQVLALFTGYANNPRTAQKGLEVLNYITETAPKDYRTGQYLMSSEQNYPDAGQQISEVTDANGNVTKTVSAGGMKKGIFGSQLDASIVQRSLTAPEIRQIRDRLESVVKEGDHANLTMARSWLHDQKSVLMSTNPADLNRYSVDKQDVYLGFLSKRAKDNPDDPVAQKEAVEAGTMIAMGRASAIVRAQLPMMAPSQKAIYDQAMEQEYDKVLKQLGAQEGTVAIADKQQFQRLNDQVWNNLITERAKDPVAYVETFAGQPQGSLVNGIPDEARVRWRLNQTDRLEMGSGLFTKDEAKGLASQLKSQAAHNPQQALQTMEDLKGKMGGFSGEAVQELMARGQLPKYFQEAYFQDNPEAAYSILKNREPDMKQSLEKLVPVAADKKKLDAAVAKSFSGASRAFAQSGGEKQSAFMQESVRLEAISIHERDGLSFDESAKRAMDKLVNSQYHVLGSAFMPKQIGSVVTNPDYVNGEMNAIYKPEVQARLGIDPPKSLDGKASREESIALGRWTTNPDNLGMTFMVPVGGKWTAVRSKDGQPVTIDFVKASINPSDEALNYNRHWWESNVHSTKQDAATDPAAVRSAPGDNVVEPAAQAASASRLNISQKSMNTMDQIRRQEATRKKRR